MYQPGGKIKPALRSILNNFSIINPFQILMGRFQNILNKAMSQSCIPGYFKCSKY